MTGVASADDTKWSDMLQALIRHGKDKNGTYNVRKTFKVIDNISENGNNVLNIGIWLHSQRENKMKGKLRSDREAILQVIILYLFIFIFFLFTIVFLLYFIVFYCSPLNYFLSYLLLFLI